MSSATLETTGFGWKEKQTADFFFLNLFFPPSSEGGKRIRQHVSFSSGVAVERETDRKFKLLFFFFFFLGGGGKRNRQ